MEKQTIQSTPALLTHAPPYAGFLLQQRLPQLVQQTLTWSNEARFPVQAFFTALSDKQRADLLNVLVEQMLQALTKNNPQQFAAVVMKHCPETGLSTNDITAFIYLNKSALCHFIADYTSELNIALLLSGEIDGFMLLCQTAINEQLTQRMSAAFEENNQLLHTILYTIPGAVSVFDFNRHQAVFSNEKLSRIIGYSKEDLNELGPNAMSSLVHPDDIAPMRAHLQKVINGQEGEVFTHRYRIKTKTGTYRWLSVHETVFKKNDEGQTMQSISITLDVDAEQHNSEELHKSRTRYEQAEVLANMGNWSWEIGSESLEWTDQLYRIYGLRPQSETITIQRFLSFIHPEDKERVQASLQMVTGIERSDETFRIITAEGETKMIRSICQVQRNDKNEAVLLVGVERDITEKQQLFDQLKKSESLYKQAQAMAHVGNWSWDMLQNRIYWSDELYRIFGMKPGELELTYESYLSLIHPEDEEKVKAQIEEAFKTGKPWKFSHRLLRKDGSIGVVYATGEVLKDAEGRPHIMMGTAQDITERQSLIERLQASEKVSSQAELIANMGHWSIDLESEDIIWSDGMYRIFELPEGTPITISFWLQFIVEEEREELVAYYRKCVEEKVVYDRIHKIISAKGTTKYVQRKGEIIQDASGRALKMIGTTQDITQAFKSQQELRDSQTFIRKITDATPSIIASYNVQTGNYVFISEGIEKLLGYTREQVMAEGISFFVQIIHPDDLQSITEKNLSALEAAAAERDRNDVVVEFTYRMRHADGDFRWFHTYGTIFDRNPDGTVAHVLNFSLDVTEQIAATEKIKEQEHFIQQIADASPTILYLFDVESQRMIYMNREIFFVLGYMPEEIIDAGEKLTERLYHPEDYHLLPGRMQSGKSFQQVDFMMQYECRMTNKEGDWRWLLVREIVFSTDEQGNIRQILGAALDIHRRKEMEKTILQNSLLLEQSNSSLEEFAYVASHDLKEPLRKISTFGDRLMASGMEGLKPEGKIYLQKIVDASQRMQTMINDLLSISMITGDNSFEAHSLQKILDETLQTLEYKIENLNAVVESDNLPQAEIIPSQIRQLFQNLLSNSLKFVRSDVQPLIRITHRYLVPHELPVQQLSAAERYLQIQFSDNGIGFENEFAAKIFAIFQRLHGRSEYEGSGIGLAICKKIVEHHGGTIFANGVPGNGATFTIILPG